MTKQGFSERVKAIVLTLMVIFTACGSPSNRHVQQTAGGKVEFERGTYGYDFSFLARNGVEAVELKDEDSGAYVLIAPGYQGRVMTSSAGGPEGHSFGWINYNLISSGEVRQQFNPVGGEERFWLGPEGGPYSIYFAEGKEQVYDNWVVPPLLDTEKFDITERNDHRVIFEKKAVLNNASGTEFKLEIQRIVTLLQPDTLEELFCVSFPGSLDIVAYQTENKLTNTGEKAWIKETGLLSVWLLCMFNPSPSTTVFIPYHTEAECVIVNDEYFGKVPSDRLIADNGTLFFKIDGKFRSKIGIPPGRAKELSGSYDSGAKILTLLWCSLPTDARAYVNSKWGAQDDPYAGDVINSYNDGPLADGSIMGPFYEIETSSPGAELLPGESITHIQRIVHVQGEEKELAEIVRTLFNLNLSNIESKFH